MPEQIKHGLDETISAILTLNTIANGLGALVIGALGEGLFSRRAMVAFTLAFGAVLLVGTEVLPKNIGVVCAGRSSPTSSTRCGGCAARSRR